MKIPQKGYYVIIARSCCARSFVGFFFVLSRRLCTRIAPIGSDAEHPVRKRRGPFLAASGGAYNMFGLLPTNIRTP